MKNSKLFHSSSEQNRYNQNIKLTPITITLTNKLENAISTL